LFEENESSSTGGAIALFNHANPIFQNSIITRNQATSGGGIYVTDGAFPHFENVTISFNNATSRGGAIYAANDANLTVSNSFIIGNIAITGPGGGVVLQDFSSMLIESSSLSVSFEVDFYPELTLIYW
jgi:predicted outer membrane repeat protein